VRSANRVGKSIIPLPPILKYALIDEIFSLKNMDFERFLICGYNLRVHIIFLLKNLFFVEISWQNLNFAATFFSL
jgi:hypothetical protein